MANKYLKEYLVDYIRLLRLEITKLEKEWNDVNAQKMRIKNVRNEFSEFELK